MIWYIIMMKFGLFIINWLISALEFFDIADIDDKVQCKTTINEWKIPLSIFQEYAKIKKELISIQNKN